MRRPRWRPLGIAFVQGAMLVARWFRRRRARTLGCAQADRVGGRRWPASALVLALVIGGVVPGLVGLRAVRFRRRRSWRRASYAAGGREGPVAFASVMTLGRARLPDRAAGDRRGGAGEQSVVGIGRRGDVGVCAGAAGVAGAVVETPTRSLQRQDVVELRRHDSCLF